MITLLGPTASGKTRVAALLAHRLNGEVISADSRQVYRGMTIGTGKDYSEYIVENHPVKVHLIDIVEPGTEYNIFRYQQDFRTVCNDITGRRKLPVLCGGSGMYIEAVLHGYSLTPAERDEAFEAEMASLSHPELCALLQSWRLLHNVTDLEERDRTMTALRIEHANRMKTELNPKPAWSVEASNVFGFDLPRSVTRQRITARLAARLEEGMVEEVRDLLSRGIEPERLMQYGLEYRYVTGFILGRLTRDEMFRLLNTAIHQFAKRQMTWFRRMERKGTTIQWVDGRNSPSAIADEIISRVKGTI